MVLSQLSSTSDYRTLHRKGKQPVEERDNLSRSEKPFKGNNVACQLYMKVGCCLTVDGGGGGGG